MLLDNTTAVCTINIIVIVSHCYVIKKRIEKGVRSLKEIFLFLGLIILVFSM